MKARLKETQEHITLDRLKEKDKSEEVRPGEKTQMDTVRMAACRAQDGHDPRRFHGRPSALREHYCRTCYYRGG